MISDLINELYNLDTVCCMYNDEQDSIICVDCIDSDEDIKVIRQLLETIDYFNHSFEIIRRCEKRRNLCGTKE